MRVDIYLADVSRYVEEKGEPADPSEELDFANPSNLKRKFTNGGGETFEECYDTVLSLGFSIPARITFRARGYADADSQCQDNARDGTKDFKLGVSEEGKIGWELNHAG